MNSSKGKVYCSMGYKSVANWLIDLGFELTSDISEATVVAFAGGQDIDTAFYGERRGRHTGSPGERDRIEQRDFNIAKETGKKMVGICRGGQLLCALSGGSLIQHVNHHAGPDHAISTYEKGFFRVNSIHHQMFNPWTLNQNDFKVLAWTSKPISNFYLNGDNAEIYKHPSFKETEIVKFNNTNSLAIQFHPEMMHRDKAYETTNAWLGNLFLKFYNDEI